MVFEANVIKNKALKDTQISEKCKTRNVKFRINVCRNIYVEKNLISNILENY
jgi:hypothetical protein